MFPLSILRSSLSPLCACREPALTLWPATQLMFGLLDDDLMRNEMERRMQRVHQAYQLLALGMERRADLRRSSAATDENTSTTGTTGNEGKENFELTLEVSGFSPEELTVRTEGRRLIVSGKHDKKKETEDGGYFHEYKEWKREVELPQDINPEDVVCSLSKDGQLHFLAPRPAAEERLIPITQSPGDGQLSPVEIQSSNPEGGEGLSPLEIQSYNPEGEEGLSHPEIQSSNPEGEEALSTPEIQNSNPEGEEGLILPEIQNSDPKGEEGLSPPEIQSSNPEGEERLIPPEIQNSDPKGEEGLSPPEIQSTDPEGGEGLRSS